MAKLELRLFGGLEILTNAKSVEGLVSRKAYALIAYLACNPTVHTRERVADLLWDDRTPAAALGNLRVLLNSIRSQVVPPVVITRNSVQVPPSPPTLSSVLLSSKAVSYPADSNGDVWMDCREFETLLQPLMQLSSSPGITPAAVADLHRALMLYQGEFLAGFHLRQAQQFEEWASLERERYHILAVKTAQTLVSYYRESREYGLGIAAAQRWIQFDPFNEQAHRYLMELLVYEGQRATAMDHYQQYLARAAAEGLSSSVALDTLYHQLRRDELSAQADTLQAETGAISIDTPNNTLIDTPTDTAFDTPQNTIPHNLPTPLTPLIGREMELAMLQSRLSDPNCRLLTMTGLGGVGKTHLAIEAMHRLVASPQGQLLFRDGIYLVRLDRIEPEQMLTSVIAGAINFTFQGALDPKTQLFHYLRGRRMLLLLDNFEHLLQHTDFLDELLQHAPHLKALVTSRERLEFIGEWLLAVTGLPHPTLDADQQHSEMAAQKSAGDSAALAWHEYPATQLFIHTAKALKPHLDVATQAAAIIEICETVEGLPLGIQLAAATVHVHQCQEIAQALRDDFDFVHSKLRNLPDRHRGLRAVFEHSWRLLSSEEQHTFAALSVFLDGFSEESAQLIADINGEMLHKLRDKSLVEQLDNQVETDPAQPLRRYRLHPVLHQYAAEQLVKTRVDKQALHKRHCHYFCQFAAVREAALSSIYAGAAADMIALELENIRAGWRYALIHNLDEYLSAMLPALIRFYRLRGYLQDALALLTSAIHELAPAPTKEVQAQRHSLLASLWVHSTEIQTELGQYEASFTAAQQAIHHAQAGRDVVGEALGYLHWGIALNYHGDYRRAKHQLGTAYKLTQEHTLPHIEALTQRHIGVNSFYQGDYTGGRLQHEAAIRYYQQTENLFQELRTYHSLAMLYFYTGDYLQARRHYVRCRDLYEKIGDRPTLALTLNNLGAISTQLGDYANARRAFEEALEIRRRLGDRQMEGLILANLGLLMHLMNKQRQAMHYCVEALEVTLEIGERDTEAYARTCLAHAYLELGQVPDALANYELAVGMRRAAGQHTQMLEPLAGLARAHLRLQEPKQALQYVEEVLAYLDIHTYAGIVELIRIYLTCYRVLYLSEDPRAGQLLTMGYATLQERAARIVDKELRQLYLENVIAHRELLTEYETRLL